MSKRDAKRDDEDEEDEEEEEEDISSSGGDDDDESGSDEEMSESGSEHGEDKATAGGGKGKAGGGGQAGKTGSERSLQNQPFDEAVDLSESEDTSEAGKDSPKKVVKPLKNMPFDEALELSASAQDLESPVKRAPPQSGKNARDGDASGAKATGASAAAAAALAAAELKNQPFDEEMDLSDSGESVDTNGPASPEKKSMKTQKPAAAQPSSTATAPAKAKETPTPAPALKKAEEKPTPEEKKAPAPVAQTTKPAPMPTKQPEKKAPEPKRKVESESSSEGSGSEEEEDDEEEEEEEEEEEPVHSKQHKARAGAGGGGGGGANAGGGANSSGGAMTSAAHATMIASAGAYKESDYAHLKVSNEVKELFQYIGRFKPQEIELETRLKCFIPEYIPAVGDMDAFLKIPRPDNEPDFLGLKMLDEPSLQQSDATVLDLQLRSTSKKKHGDIVVRSIENAEKSPKEIDRWIKSIADLHRTKPPPQVHYTKPMPDIESLMQVWPDEFEELLGKAKLPGASLDISLEQYIRVICAILDIPVYKNVFESLHVLFTLYLEFRSNQHFMNYDEQLDVSSAQAQQQEPPPFTSRREEVGFQDDYSGSTRK